MLSAFPKLLVKLCNPSSRRKLPAVLSEQEVKPATDEMVYEKEQADSAAERAKKRPLFRRLAGPRTFRLRNWTSQAPNQLTTSNQVHNLELPFNYLPVELLLDIFTHICHSDYDKYLWDKERYKKTTPLTLGSVCGYWRETILTYSALWSHIYISLSAKRYTRQLKLLNHWLERSGDLPLLLNMVLVREDDWDAKRIPDSMIDILLEHSTRWRAISWVLPEAWYPRLNQISDKLINLHSICTQPTYKDADQSPTLRERLIFLECAPKLEKLHLNGYYLADVPLQWIQLTHLTLQQVYIDECYYALQRSSNLTRFKVSKLLVNDVNRTVECPSSRIAMENMKKFILHASAWKDAVQLLVHVDFPVVETLDLSGSRGDAMFVQLSKAILSASANLKVGLKVDVLIAPSTLTSLILRDVNLDFSSESVTYKELKDLLVQLPSLETLDIQITNRSLERTRFCIWWFIELLKAHQLSGTQTDGFPDSSSSISEIGRASPAMEELPPAPQPNEVFFHLPNLRHFMFEVPDIFTHSYTPQHCEPSGLGRGLNDRLFMGALFELLKQRSCKSSPFRQKVGDEKDSAVNLPLGRRLQEFSLKSDKFLTRKKAPMTEGIRKMLEQTRNDFEQLKHEGFSFKLTMGLCRWNNSF